MSVQTYDQSDDSGPWSDQEKYVYRDPDTGQDHHLVIKQVNGQIDPKTGKAKKRFIQLHNPGGEPLHLGTPFEQTNWKRGAPEEFVLWDAPEVIKARDILHVEGEGVAILLNEKLKEAGLYGDMVATTSPGGAKTWQLYLAEAYRGKYVYVYPDWDQDGYDYAAAVAADSKSSGALVVKIVELDGRDQRTTLKTGSRVTATRSRSSSRSIASRQRGRQRGSLRSGRGARQSRHGSMVMSRLSRFLCLSPIG
jgi:hypothetical protein